MTISSSLPFVFFSSLSLAAEFIALPLLRLCVFYIPLISTNTHMAVRPRLVLTQWRDFDSWSETEESDEDVWRYKFLSSSPTSWVLNLAWPQFCSHLHLSSLLLSEEVLLSASLPIFWSCISGSVVHEHIQMIFFGLRLTMYHHHNNLCRSTLKLPLWSPASDTVWCSDARGTCATAGRSNAVDDPCGHF